MPITIYWPNGGIERRANGIIVMPSARKRHFRIPDEAEVFVQPGAIVIKTANGADFKSIPEGKLQLGEPVAETALKG